MVIWGKRDPGRQGAPSGGRVLGVQRTLIVMEARYWGWGQVTSQIVWALRASGGEDSYYEGITGETVALRLLWVLALAFVGPSFNRKMLKIIFHDSMDMNMNSNHADFDLMYSLLLHSSFLLILKEMEIYTFLWALIILGPDLVVPLSVAQAAWVPSRWGRKGHGSGEKWSD